MKTSEWKPEPKCAYLAPYVCFQNQTSHAWHIVQSCCNHWDCPRCGIIRAKEEYARIVEGAKSLDKEGRRLFFWTITCRGKDIIAQEAETGYLSWTNRLMDSAHHKAKRAAEFWCYVQVTERQKRGHPHSHIITTYCPPDAQAYNKGAILPNSRRARHDTLWSDWFRGANTRAGLGAECEISAVKSAEAVSRYVGKYLFKQTASDRWPKGWKRVRYSQNWPKLPEISNKSAFPVITFADWFRVWDLREPVRADSVTTYAAAQARGIENVIAPAW